MKTVNQSSKNGTQFISSTNRTVHPISTIIALVVVCLLSVTNVKAQDAHFSQYFSSPTYYNPAYTGLSLGMKVRFHGRKLFNNLPGENYATNFSMDIADRNIPGAGGIGMLFNQTSEGLGYIKTTTAGFLPAVRIPLSQNAIVQVGAMASFVTRQVNWDGMIFPDQLDPRWGYIGPSTFANPANNKVVFPDFSFGGIFQFEGNNVIGTLGGAVHHMMEPNQSFLDVDAPLPRRYVGHFDLIIDVSEYEGYYNRRKGFRLNPGIIYEQQASLHNFNIGFNLYMSHVYLGIWYRNDALEYTEYADLILLAGMNIGFSENSRMKLVYTHDMAISTNNNFAGPSHEISLILEFDNLRFFRESEIIKNVRSRNFSPIECSPF
jgi:type IX secretion system PorP/SprF family membrane protein